jgi:RNA polymerase sigma-70 factor, ECF subfamily
MSGPSALYLPTLAHCAVSIKTSMITPPETELIARAQRGDVDAFCLLVSGHQRVMLALAMRFSGNHHDAEDLVQEVFLSAYRAIGRFRGEASFHTWLRRIMVNSFLSHKRRKTPQHLADVTDSAGFPTAGSDRTAFNNVMVQQILQRLDEIPARQRLMFIMKHQEGLTCQEIAEYFGTTVGTVKKTVFRIVDKLRQEFHTPKMRGSERSNARLSEVP